MAAFVNGALTHAIDYDDFIITGNQPHHHPIGSIFPAALAVAEKVGASGRDFITALVWATTWVLGRHPALKETCWKISLFPR